MLMVFTDWDRHGWREGDREEKERVADRRERQDVKHRWRNSSQHDLSCACRQGSQHTRELGRKDCCVKAGYLCLFLGSQHCEN